MDYCLSNSQEHTQSKNILFMNISYSKPMTKYFSTTRIVQFRCLNFHYTNYYNIFTETTPKFVTISHIMTQMLFEVVSANNYSEKCLSIFHKFSRSVVGWESTEYAITPIEVLFKLQDLTFVTEIYLHPKLYKSIKKMEVFVSDNSFDFFSVATIHDFNDGVRVEISAKCKFIKFVILEKDHGKAASIDFLRVYGHQYFMSQKQGPLFSQKHNKIEEILLGMGIKSQKNWEVDQQTLVTLYDMSKIKRQYLDNRQQSKLQALLSDFKVVMKIGKRIKQLQNQLKWVNAKEQYKKIKDIEDQIKILKKRRDHFDEKYQTSRFQEMIAIGDNDQRHNDILKNLLEQDQKAMEQARLQREKEAMENQAQIDKQYEDLDDETQWWKQKNQLDKVINQKPIKPKTPHKSQPEEKQGKFNFDNPYVYNQGDADLQRFIKPLLQQSGGGYLGDPDLLRRYEQLQLLDVLGARIWVAAHSQNWRQRAAAVQAVLDFSQSDLPERYKNGQTKHLFLALMQFARITAQDKVLQIYYTSLKIMSVALAPPICGDDVSPALINKSVQKFLAILIQKISQMNSRAKQISMKTLLSIFQHPATDISIAVNQTLKVCKQQLNVKFIPVDKQNPRIVQSRLQIIQNILANLPSEKKKINYQDILNLLVKGSLHHSQNQVRLKGIQVLMLIHKNYPDGSIQWFKSQTGLKPNIVKTIQEKLSMSS